MNITFSSCVSHMKNSWYNSRLDSAMSVKGNMWKMNIIFFSCVLHMNNSWYISKCDSAMYVKGNMWKMNITFFSFVLQCHRNTVCTVLKKYRIWPICLEYVCVRVKMSVNCQTYHILPDKFPIAFIIFLISLYTSLISYFSSLAFQ